MLFESRSLVHGKWPAFTCRKGVGEGFFSRVAYTWVAVFWLSFVFYFFAIFMYSVTGRQRIGQFSSYASIAFQMTSTRSMSWMLIAFVPIMGIVFDVTGKVFSNMFFPTQTQIHLEIESHTKMQARFRGELSTRKLRKQQKKQEREAGRTLRNDIP